MNEERPKNFAEEDEMTFWDHLEELRGVLIRSAVAVVVLSIVAFSFKHILFDYVVLGPGREDFITYRVLCHLGKMISVDSFCFDVHTLKFINITLAGQFVSHMTIALIAGIIMASPFIVYQFWRFIRPALTDQEKNRSKGVVFIISSLFITGVLFSYFLVVPLMVNFLGNYQVSEMVPNQVTLSSFTSAVTSMCLIMGVMFEFPVVLVFLTKIGIVTPKVMKKYRKHTFVAILLISGLITPSPDVFSQMVVTIPLYVLYEISLGIASRVYREKMKEEV
ncbi:MAG: twin-arginine translocase subunit TatC [Syntrophothermus sp.]